MSKRVFAIGCLSLALFPLASAPRAQSDAPGSRVFTYGGNGRDIVNAVTVDPQGNIFIAGLTTSTNLPGLENAFQKQPRGPGGFAGAIDAFVAKLDAEGRVLWSTYLGGNDARMITRFAIPTDEAKAIAVDAQGNVWVAGATGSTDFPTTANAFQRSPLSDRMGGTDGFLAKLSRDGSELLYSTYLGGADDSSTAEALAAGSGGDVWVGIRTMAAQFPHMQNLSTGAGSLVLGRFSSSGTALALSRLGSSGDSIVGLALNPFGQPHVGSYSPSREYGVTQVDASGSRVNFSWSLTTGPLTTIPPRIGDLAVAADGTTVLVGATGGRLPLLNAFQPTPGSIAGDAFVAVLNFLGAPTMISYLGGSGSESAVAAEVAVDLSGGLHVALDTSSVDLPAVRGIVPHHPDGPAFASRDRGRSWWWAASGLPSDLADMTIDPYRHHVYAASTSGIYRLADDDSTWRLWRSTPGFSRLRIDPTAPTIMYGGSTDLYRIDGDGQSMTLLRRSSAGVGGFRVGELEVSPHDGSVWVGSGNGLEVSFDRGETWSHRDRGFRSTVVGTIESPDVVAFDPAREGVVYAAVSDATYRTRDNGVTWEDFVATLRSPEGLPERPFVRAMAVDPGDSNRVYLGTFNRGLAITDDGGATWRRALPNTAITALAADYAPPFQVYAAARDNATQEFHILVSRDRGASWSPLPDAPQIRSLTTLLVHPRDASRVYAFSSGAAPAPYLVRLARQSDVLFYDRSFASYFLSGNVSDVSATPGGGTLIAFNNVGVQDIALVRIDR